MRLPLLGLSLVLLASPSLAETVTATASATSQGQAYVFRLAEGCFAATPAHVLAREDGPLSSPILRARDGREAQGLDPVRPDRELDLAFVRVAGALSAPCGSPENLGLDLLDHRLRTGGDLTLHVARTGTSAQQIPVRVSRFNKTYLFVAPTGGLRIDAVMQSMSGGLVAGADGVPFGMLLLVDPDTGLATALRFDLIKALALRALGRTGGGRDDAAARRPFTVARWSGETVDAARPPAVVLSGGEWRARPVDRRVALEFHAAAPAKVSRVTVARSLAGDEEADVMTVWSGQRPGGDWVLLRSCTRRQPGDPSLFDCAFAPTETGALKLEFGRRSGGIVAVGRVDVR
jgi:hypothetical protein